MKKQFFAALLLILSIFVFAGCSTKDEADTKTKPAEQKVEKKEPVELTVSAAASLTDAMTDLQKAFQKEHPEVTFSANFGSSGNLAQQIQQGAPADIFLSADQKWMNTLADQQLILTDTRKDFTGNKLVLITGKDKDIKISSFEDLKADQLGQVAIGDPASVPAGTYTKQALEKLGKWAGLESHFVLGSDVRQVLTYVESGNTDIGFIYSSDAVLSDKVKVLAEADPSLHTPIIYPAAVLKDSKSPEAAKEFVDFLGTKGAQDILGKYGFKK
ncbi:molybdate ABC transporter substrate-binding protein [Bacillus sp. 03113]|uniref:molybdate ABC transporter substrate-binding protein n=1 Tax=Bacillus sp. 03113 TaxID=2578211 RepID=UPI001143E7BB|nr:molybdate ABC transporter substrate-binding protein [Bacillus sp. 03113]